MAQSERNNFQKSKQMMVNNDSNLHSESTDHNNNMASSGASGMKQVNMNNQMPIDKFYKPLCSEAAVNNENTNNQRDEEQLLSFFFSLLSPILLQRVSSGRRARRGMACASPYLPFDGGVDVLDKDTFRFFTFMVLYIC